MRERFRVGLACGAQLGRDRVHVRLGELHRALRRFDRIAARSGITQLALGSRGELQQLVVRGRCKATLEIGDRLETLLDALELSRPSVDRRDEAMEIGAQLAEPHREVAELFDTWSELGREALDRCERTLRSRGERSGAFALVRGDRRGGGVRRFCELLDMPQPFAPPEQLILVRRSHSLGRLDERLQLGEPERDGIGVARQLLVAASSRSELAPGEASLAPELDLLRPAVGIEDVELKRRTREPALLELARHRDQTLRGGCDVFARDRPTPGVRPRAAVAEDAARDHEPCLTLRAQLGERRDVVLVEEALRHVELRLDVGLRSVGADGGRVGARAEQQANRLREDRLAGASLSRDGVQTRSERELRLTDEDEVLDPEATKHDRPQRARSSSRISSCRWKGSR